MGHGWGTVHTVTMASGGSHTPAIDLGRAYPTVYVEIASTPSGSDYQVKAAATLNGTYNLLYHPAVNTVTATVNPYTIPSGVTGAIVPIPGGFQFIKIVATAAMTNGAVYRVYVCDE